MNKVISNKQEIFALIEDAEEISSVPTKHDYHRTTYVVARDNTHYKFSVEYSYNDGMQSDSITLVEVYPKEITTTLWVPKER